jgi:hypothetical protein
MLPVPSFDLKSEILKCEISKYNPLYAFAAGAIPHGIPLVQTP